MEMFYSFFVFAMMGVGIFWVYYLIAQKGHVKKDKIGKMRDRLLRLLQDGGFQYEVRDGFIIVHFQHEWFRIQFSESVFGSGYARVLIIDDYIIDRMENLHPIVMDALMGNASTNRLDIGNISFEDHCTCYYATDMSNIKAFYGGLPGIFERLIFNEYSVRQDFEKFYANLGQKKSDATSHIGFRFQSVNHVDSTVAAQTDIDGEGAECKPKGEI